MADNMTDDERALLLGRGDVVGKALARPDELSLSERTASCSGRRPTCCTPLFAPL